jgi:hypothetical protein
MPIATIALLVIQYGPEGIALIEAAVAALKPLFADGAQPTPEQINAALISLDLQHARLQATR